jgi:DegV family protein with EDD domain
VVVTDSSATVPEQLARELDIHIVPMVLTLGGRSYRDGIDLTPGEFYDLLQSQEHLPTTSAASVGDFHRIYAAAARDSAGVVAIHLPPQLSSIHDTAVLASRLVDGAPIRVLNSNSVSMAQGFVVLEAARAAAAGASLDTVEARAREMMDKVHFLAILDTLEYLHRGGRIGGAAVLLGTALQIKPVLFVREGLVEPLASPRTKRKAIRLILDRIARQVGDRPLHVAVLHAGALSEARDLQRLLTMEFVCLESFLGEFTPVMGAHTGPGLLGIAYYAD